MMKLFVLMIAAQAMEVNQELMLEVQQNQQRNLFGTSMTETCLSCYDEYEKLTAYQKMVAVYHREPLDCTHYIYCRECYKQYYEKIDLLLGKALIGRHVKNCPKDRQSGVLIYPEQNENGIDENVLNHMQVQKHDSLTQHLIINSTMLVVMMSMWIAFEQDSHLRHTWEKLGYFLQQLVRTYFGYVSFAGWIYSFCDCSFFKWKNAEKPRNLKPSYIVLYLFTITTKSLMLGTWFCSQAFQTESGEMPSNVASLTSFTSWFTMIGGLIIGIYSQIFQKKTIFQHRRFSNFQLSQPQAKLCGNVQPQTFGGYLMGVLFTIIPLFHLLQGIAILHRQQVSPGMYSPWWHQQVAGSQILTSIGVFGIIFGGILTLASQITRFFAEIGVFTLDNFMLAGISFFLSHHADPAIGANLLFGELFAVIVAIVLAVCYWLKT